MNPFLKRLSSDIPLMECQTLAYLSSLQLTKDNIEMAEHPSVKAFKEKLKPQMEIKDGAAIIPIQGALAYNPDAFEMIFGDVEDSRNVLSMINKAASDPNIRGILLRMDTPGGMLLGGPEMADAVADTVKGGKPVVTHIGGLGASLGYMIASQSSNIFASRSAIVGSIGVIASIPDYSDILSKFGIRVDYFTNSEAIFKGTGAMGSRLTQAQRENIQGSVDSAAQMFKDMVTSKRPQVKPETMQGQTFRGEEAKRNGLIDDCCSEEWAFAYLQKMMPEQATSGPYA